MRVSPEATKPPGQAPQAELRAAAVRRASAARSQAQRRAEAVPFAPPASARPAPKMPEVVTVDEAKPPWM